MSDNQEKEITTEVVETETVLSPEAADSIAKSVAASMEETVNKAVEAAMAAKATHDEATVAKSVDAGIDANSEGSGFTVGKSSPEFDKMSKEMFLAKHVQATLRGDGGAKKAMDDYAFELRTKAGFNNTGVTTEGGYLVALPDFEAEIQRLLPQYGAMASEVTFVDVTGNTVYTNKGTDNIAFAKVLEGAAKPARKAGYSQQTITLNKYAAILLASQELLEDQAVDFWADATTQFAYAYGKKIDEMVLTDNGTTASEKGILHTSGVTYEPVSSPSAITLDDLLNAQYRIPGAANSTNGIFVMHRSTLNTLRQLKGVSNDYLQQGIFSDNGNLSFNGSRIVLTDAMPDQNQANWNGTTNGGGVVYGDFKRYAKVYRKSGGLQMKVSDTATVVDSGSTTQNLWQNNLVGMLGEFRAASFFKFPEAFAVVAQTNIS